MAKKSTKAKTPPKAKKPAKTSPKIFNNDDPEARALFLQHLPTVKSLRAKVATATANLRNAYKTAKAQGGFEKIDFDYAVDVETAEAEAKARAKIARRLTIARYMGSDLGAQLELFLEPDRTPAADRAYHEGQSDSMQSKTAKPDYAPETEQYRQYMAGYHDDQAKRVKKGIKKLKEEAIEEDAAETKEKKAAVKKQQDADAKAFETPTSGTPMTRAEFLAKQEDAALNKGSHFTKAS